MYNFDEPPPALKADSSFSPASVAMLDEVHNHLVFVLKERLGWMDATRPEMSAGGGHIVIRFERGGQRYVFRVGKHGVDQHKRTMLAYRHIGHLGFIPEKVYHDGISLLERYADGIPLSPQVNDLVLRRFAEALSTLHSMPAQGFGPLTFNTQGYFLDAAAYYDASPAVELDWSEADLADEHLLELEAAVLDVNTIPPALLAAPVHLGHGDLWRNSVLVTTDQFKILDWDRIGAYPIERDLVFLLELDFSKAQRETFFSYYAWRDSVDLQLMRWFAKRRLMGDRGIRLGKKLAKIREIDKLIFASKVR
jgi:hypothetical protein